MSFVPVGLAATREAPAPARGRIVVIRRCSEASCGAEGVEMSCCPACSSGCARHRHVRTASLDARKMLELFGNDSRNIGHESGSHRASHAVDRAELRPPVRLKNRSQSPGPVAVPTLACMNA